MTMRRDRLEVRYKCRCMEAEAIVGVPYREKDEDLLIWMNGVQRAIGTNHHSRSPYCRATAMEYAKLPMPENSSSIGMKPEVN